MKNYCKIILTTIMSIALLVSVSESASAQVSKKNAKQEKKQEEKNFKEKVKEWEKGGWKISGDYRTLELAAIELQNKLNENPEKYDFTTGLVSKCRSIDACKQMAQFQAQGQLTTELNAEMKGTGDQLLNADITTGDETNTLVTGFSRAAKANVSGILTPSFSLIKENGDGTNSFQILFLVDLVRKAAVQKGALESAIKESKLTIEKAELIRDFVNKSLEESETENAEE
ncbi:MAG: hypothetical protein LBT56_01755 [Prevotellaceae bacterium]|nr:hypothetical protein [Prevotellaceae bacterium]